MNGTGRIFILAVALVAFFAAVSKASDLLFTSDAKIVAVAELNHAIYDMGDVFRYETGFGKVEVKSKSESENIKLAIKRKTEFQYSYFNIRTDSYFAGTQIGAAHSDAWSASIKRLIPVRCVKKNNGHLALKYTILDNASISPISFLEFFETRKAGTLTVTYGAVSYFGGGVKEKLSGFGSVEYAPDEKLELFAEYTGADFAKAVQAYVIAPSAQNVGVINTGSLHKDALSAGVSFFPIKTAGITFALYDLDYHVKPILRFTLKK